MIGAGLRMLVVGAGIGGLGAARALRQRGFAADVVEREPAWAHAGAGIYLPGNAARALRALGLESTVAQRASPIPHQRLCDHRGHLLADIDTAALWGDVGPCLALHRPDLDEVLASHGDPLPVQMGVSLWTVLLGRGVTFLAVPIGGGQVYCYCDAPRQQHPPAGRRRDRAACRAPDRVRRPGGGPPRHARPRRRTPRQPNRGGDPRPVVTRIGAAHRGRCARHVTQYGRRRRDGSRGRPGPRRVPCLRARHRPDGGDLPGSAPPTRAWVLAQTHHRDRTRNLPPALRNLVLRRWGRNIFHANYQPLLELP